MDAHMMSDRLKRLTAEPLTFIAIAQPYKYSCSGNSYETTMLTIPERVAFSDQTSSFKTKLIPCAIDHAGGNNILEHNPSTEAFVVPEDKQIGRLVAAMVRGNGDLLIVGEIWSERPERHMIISELHEGKKWGVSLCTDLIMNPDHTYVYKKDITHVGVTRNPDYGSDGTWIYEASASKYDIYEKLLNNYIKNDEQAHVPDGLINIIQTTLNPQNIKYFNPTPNAVVSVGATRDLPVLENANSQSSSSSPTITTPAPSNNDGAGENQTTLVPSPSPSPSDTLPESTSLSETTEMPAIVEKTDVVIVESESATTVPEMTVVDDNMDVVATIEPPTITEEPEAKSMETTPVVQPPSSPVAPSPPVQSPGVQSETAPPLATTPVATPQASPTPPPPAQQQSMQQSPVQQQQQQQQQYQLQSTPSVAPPASSSSPSSSPHQSSEVYNNVVSANQPATMVTPAVAYNHPTSTPAHVGHSPSSTPSPSAPSSAYSQQQQQQQQQQASSSPPLETRPEYQLFLNDMNAFKENYKKANENSIESSNLMRDLIRLHERAEKLDVDSALPFRALPKDFRRHIAYLDSALDEARQASIDFANSYYINPIDRQETMNRLNSKDNQVFRQCLTQTMATKASHGTVYSQRDAEEKIREAKIQDQQKIIEDLTKQIESLKRSAEETDNNTRDQKRPRYPDRYSTPQQQPVVTSVGATADTVGYAAVHTSTTTQQQSTASQPPSSYSSNAPPPTTRPNIAYSDSHMLMHFKKNPYFQQCDNYWQAIEQDSLSMSTPGYRM